MGPGAYPLRQVAGASSSVADVAAAFRNAERITALCHERPDADTLGAATACALIGERLGIASEVVCADPVPRGWRWLPRAASIVRRPRLEPGLAVACDCATAERIGIGRAVEAAWLAEATLVSIDHHASSASFGDLNLIVPAASATCEILVDVVAALGLELDADLATVLLAGIVRDTRGFADPSATAATLRTAATLVDAGAPLALLQRDMLANQSRPGMALWGQVLAEMRAAMGGRVVYGSVTRAMIHDTGASDDDAEGLVELMASGRGVALAILARELDENATRISVRTTDGVDAHRLAAVFGGGGHATRAGCVIAAPAAESVGIVLGEAVRQMGSA